MCGESDGQPLYKLVSTSTGLHDRPVYGVAWGANGVIATACGTLCTTSNLLLLDRVDEGPSRLQTLGLGRMRVSKYPDPSVCLHSDVYVVDVAYAELCGSAQGSVTHGAVAG